MWFLKGKREENTDAKERAERGEDRLRISQVEAGKKVSDVCREMGVSAQAFYSWKRRFAGLGVSELRELRQLREENQKLKC